MKRKTISIFMVLLLIFNLLPVSVLFANASTTNAALSLDNASGKAGDIVDINVSLSNNPGIVALRIFIDFDIQKLQLIDVTDGGLLGLDTFIFGNNYNISPYTMMWEDSLSSSNHTGNGTLVTMSFRILDDTAPCNIPITLTYDQGSTFNVNLEDVVFQTSNGNITVRNDETNLACIAVQQSEGRQGELVNVPIVISNNPGIVALRISISYDPSKLQLVEVNDGGLLGTNTAVFGNDYSLTPYTVLWEDSLAVSNHMGNGVIATLKFRIVESTPPGLIPINIDYDSGSTFNCSLEDVSFDTVSGSVNVISNAAYIYSAEGTTTVIDSANGFIYGISGSVTSLSGLVETMAGVTLQLTYSNGINCGTGSLVEVCFDGEIVESYHIVVLGDISGDGQISALDALMTLQNASRMVVFDAIKTFAGDVNNSSDITSLDALKILQFASGNITEF